MVVVVMVGDGGSHVGGGWSAVVVFCGCSCGWR